jgi:hypothetical protein
MPLEHEDLPPTGARQSGVAVEKRPTFVTPDLAVVRLRLAATGVGPRIVRLVDELPPGVDRGDLGFDSESGPDWRHENDEVWFTALLEGEAVETRYGVRNLDHDAVPAFEEPPRIDAVVPIERREGRTPTAGD